MDTNQKMRYSQAELQLMKDTFSENDNIYAVRSVFYQFGLTDNQKQIISSFNPEILRLIKKVLLPDLEPEIPLGQQADTYFALANLKELNPALAQMQIEAKDIEHTYLTERFQSLRGEETKGRIDLVSLKEKGNKNEEERYIEMLAYLNLCSFMDVRFNEIQTLAGLKDETPEETVKRLQKDSTK